MLMSMNLGLTEPL